MSSDAAAELHARSRRHVQPERERRFDKHPLGGAVRRGVSRLRLGVRRLRGGARSADVLAEDHLRTLPAQRKLRPLRDARERQP